MSSGRRPLEATQPCCSGRPSCRCAPSRKEAFFDDLGYQRCRRLFDPQDNDCNPRHFVEDNTAEPAFETLGDFKPAGLREPALGPETR